MAKTGPHFWRFTFEHGDAIECMFIYAQSLDAAKWQFESFRRYGTDLQVTDVKIWRIPDGQGVRYSEEYFRKQREAGNVVRWQPVIYQPKTERVRTCCG
jgi:hypothetical protein